MRGLIRRKEKDIINVKENIEEERLEDLNHGFFEIKWCKRLFLVYLLGKLLVAKILLLDQTWRIFLHWREIGTMIFFVGLETYHLRGIDSMAGS